MEKTQTPSQDHAQFDSICAEVDEFEPLPTVTGQVADGETGGDQAPDAKQHTASLDRLILAGLVSPY